MSVFVCGFNRKGQLGLRDTIDRPIPDPVKLVPDERVAKICTGGLFTAIVTNKGDLLVAGCGKYGRLGTGSEEDLAIPTKIVLAKDTKVAAVSGGNWHTCAVTYLGRLYSWGYNSKHNVLGRDSEKKFSLSPGIVSSFLGVSMVSCGHNYTLVVTTDGAVYSWGCGRYGVLGHGNEECATHPKKIQSLTSIAIKTVDAGYAHCGAVSEDGRLYMFGKGCDGALGLGEDLKNKTEPVWLSDLIPHQITAISCSVGEHRSHTLTLTSIGEVFAFGSNYSGKLGLGDCEPRLMPSKLDPCQFHGQTVVQVSAGGIHSGAVTSGGLVFTWGSGKDGRLGHEGGENHLNTYYSALPRQITCLPKDKRGTQISCSRYHTVILMEFASQNL